MTNNKVSATPAALKLIAEIVSEHGPILFHQSGGCCDGSSPLCFPRDEFTVGDQDVLLGGAPRSTKMGNTRSPWRYEEMRSAARAQPGARGRRRIYCAPGPSLYLKNEICIGMPWRVEILNEIVVAEIAALPADMQARFLRLAERIGQAGLESLGEPHVKHLEGKLWELRLTGRDGIARALYVTAIGRRVVVVRAFVKKTQKTPPAEIKLALQRAKEIT
jgi:phage-related protein